MLPSLRHRELLHIHRELGLSHQESNSSHIGKIYQSLGHLKKRFRNLFYVKIKEKFKEKCFCVAPSLSILYIIKTTFYIKTLTFEDT